MHYIHPCSSGLASSVESRKATQRPSGWFEPKEHKHSTQPKPRPSQQGSKQFLQVNFKSPIPQKKAQLLLCAHNCDHMRNLFPHLRAASKVRMRSCTVTNALRRDQLSSRSHKYKYMRARSSVSSAAFLSRSGSIRRASVKARSFW